MSYAFTLENLNHKNYPVTGMITANLLVLYQRVKVVEAKFMEAGGAPFLLTSGLRSQAHQESLIKAGKTTASKSKHLYGMACDVIDPDGAIKKYLKENPKVLEDTSLWCEHWDYTFNWCHFQTSPPASGNRWFIP